MPTFYESYKDAQRIRTEMKEARPRRTQSTKKADHIKLHAMWWESWTGSRFVRERNPVVDMNLEEFMRSNWSNGTNTLPKIEDVTVRSCPLTGDWKIIND